jgi:hypothetical protein
MPVGTPAGGKRKAGAKIGHERCKRYRKRDFSQIFSKSRMTAVGEPRME